MIRKKEAINALIVGVSLLFITALHYCTPTQKTLYHDFYRRFYYIPIIYASIRFGLRGGMVSAVVTSVLYAPHVLFHWGFSHPGLINKVLEIMMFSIVGCVTGLLAEGERRQRERYLRTAEELRESLVRLEDYQEHMRQADRLKALGELSSGIAHEIRNPLCSIKGSVEILKTDYQRDDPKREVVSVLLKEVDRVNRVVEDFLRFARPTTPELLPCNIIKVLEQTLRLVSAQATKANIEVRLKTAEGLPEIKADTQQLQQVFLNIVLNAIQGMPDGGKLNIVGAKEGNYIQIRFEDTGPGIPPEDMKRIFDPFFSTKKDGTGLGLSIAHRIVAAHKGKIEVESSVGKGSTFIVKLPICEERDEKGHHIGDR